MNLPKYIPGLTVVARESDEVAENKRIYPEGFGMFVIADAFLEHEEWHYQNYNGEIQFHEHEIVGVINQGYYVPAEKFNGVQEAPEYNAEAKSAFDKMLETDAEEEQFIKKTLKEHLADQKKKAKKTKKIKVTDESTDDK